MILLCGRGGVSVAVVVALCVLKIRMRRQLVTLLNAVGILMGQVGAQLELLDVAAPVDVAASVDVAVAGAETFILGSNHYLVIESVRPRGAGTNYCNVH